VHPHISTGLKRLKKQLKARSTDDRITALLNSLPGNATLLDWDLRITNMSTSARRLSAQWMGRANESLPRALELPHELLDACAEMKEAWREALREDPQTQLLNKRVITRDALTAEITMVLQQESVLAHPGFLVRLNESAPSTEAPRGDHVALDVLSPAEREAVLLVAEGLINPEIAARLGISVAAVKLRLHGAFKKLNVRNRMQLVAMLR
jgi:DNA-binding CsgD family transcriptional regulator